MLPSIPNKTHSIAKKNAEAIDSKPEKPKNFIFREFRSTFRYFYAKVKMSMKYRAFIEIFSDTDTLFQKMDIDILKKNVIFRALIKVRTLDLQLGLMIQTLGVSKIVSFLYF